MNVWIALTWPFKLAHWLQNFLARISYGLLVGAGGVMLCVSIVVAQLIADRGIALTVLGFGSFGSALILGLYLPKLILTVVQERESQIIRDREDLKIKLEQSSKAQREVVKLEREIARLSSTRIEINSHKAILKLGLLELDWQIKDFWQEQLHEETATRASRGELHEFLGCLELKFRASLGVDLRKLRFRFHGADAILVSGLESEFQGFSHLDEHWKLKEVRVKKWGGILPESYEVHPEDGRIADATIRQRKMILDRLNQGSEFRHLDGGIKRFAREAIHLLLLPLAREVIFQDGPIEDGHDLLEFLSLHNRNVEKQIRSLEESRHQLKV
jgi:hypothetical protein